MTRYYTGNPVGSSDPRDLYDNAENLDVSINGNQDEWIDRLGKQRVTIVGANKQLASAITNANATLAIAESEIRSTLQDVQSESSLILSSLGYLPPVEYAAGINVDSGRFTVTYDGSTYAANADQTPFTTGAIFDPSQWRLVQGVTSSDLASDVGAKMLGYKRSQANGTIGTVSDFIDSLPIQISEYASLVTSRPSADTGTWDWAPAFDAAVENSAISGIPITLKVKGRVGVSRTVIFKGSVSLDTSEGEIVALPSFASGTAVIQFGTSTDIFTGYNREINVDGANQRVIAVLFQNHQRSFNPRIRFRRTLYIGLETRTGFGSNFQNVSGSASSKISGDDVNADYDSIGIHGRSSDCSYGTGDISGFATGVMAIGSNSAYHDFHVWGTYIRSYGESSCPLMFGIRNEGQGNTFVGCIADGVSLRDYSAAPSLTNGGYGFYNRANGFQAKFIGCNVFIPDRRTFGEVLPTSNSVVPFMSVQSTNWIGNEAIDYTGLVLSASRYQGSALNTSLILSRSDISVYSSSQPTFQKRPFLGKGMEFMVRDGGGYQDADEKLETWGTARFGMPYSHGFEIRTNWGGTKRTTTIPMRAKGNSSEQSALATALRAAAVADQTADPSSVVIINGVPARPNDIGYDFYNTQDFRPRRWDGSQFRLYDGTVG